MEHLQIVYTSSFQSATGRPFQTSREPRVGFCRVLRQVFALRNLDDLFGLTQQMRAERRLGAMIKKAGRAFARPAVSIDQLTQPCRESGGMRLLLQNGWRVRKLTGTKGCVVESN